MLLLNACAVIHADAPARIALLAPFEGRYREVGYNALYAARLALEDSGSTYIELLAVDDGDSDLSAVDRAKALAQDPLVKAIMVLGYAGTTPEAQRAFDNLPVLIVGHWSAKPETYSVFILASPEIDSLVTPSPRVDIVEAAALEAPVVGSEILALEQFPKLRSDVDDITIVSSASLPDATFTERYINSAEFTPQPGLLATLTYDAMALILQSIETNTPFADMTYSGLNGSIHFENGYWVNAPIHYYQYNGDRQLIQVTEQH